SALRGRGRSRSSWTSCTMRKRFRVEIAPAAERDIARVIRLYLPQLDPQRLAVYLDIRPVRAFAQGLNSPFADQRLPADVVPVSLDGLPQSLRVGVQEQHDTVLHL